MVFWWTKWLKLLETYQVHFIAQKHVPFPLEFFVILPRERSPRGLSYQSSSGKSCFLEEQEWGDTYLFTLKITTYRPFFRDFDRKICNCTFEILPQNISFYKATHSQYNLINMQKTILVFDDAFDTLTNTPFNSRLISIEPKYQFKPSNSR